MIAMDFLSKVITTVMSKAMSSFKNERGKFETHLSLKVSNVFDSQQ